MRTVYKVRHKATGLFYKPGRHNLSDQGKIYKNKQTIISYLGDSCSITLWVSKGSKLFKKYEATLMACPACRVTDWYWECTCKAEDFELVEFCIEDDPLKEKRKYDSSNWRVFSVKLAKAEPDNLITRDGRDAKFIRELNQDECLVEVDGLQYRIGELGYARQDLTATANDIFLKGKERDLFQIELDKILSDALIHSTELTDEFVKSSAKVLKNNLIDTIFKWVETRYFFDSLSGCRLVPAEEVKEQLKQDLI